MSQNESRQNDQQEEEVLESGPGGLTQILIQTPSWLVSTIVHTVLLLTFALMTVSGAQQAQISEYVAPPVDEIEEEEEIEEIDINIEDIDPEQDLVDEIVEFTNDVSDEVSVEAEEPAPAIVEVDPMGIGNMVASDVGTSIASFSGTGHGLRKAAKKSAIVNGATNASELAVARGLKWISEHQYANGGWNYDHRFAPKCQSKCKNPGGYTKAVNGATAMGILPFLGSGITHKEGAKHYRQTVYRGLQFLCSRIQPNGSFHYPQMDTGTMYAHGLATLCLVEAYGLTGDPVLEEPAQRAIYFIAYAQDPAGGGWRYQIKQRGDTSVTAMQLTALKTGCLAHLKVPQDTTQKAMRFLDSVQAGGGAYYGYDVPEKNHPACSAAGLLCRRYYGWELENPALKAGVEELLEAGPSETDNYFNYYATLLMWQAGGEAWQQWNPKMRDQLVETQVADKTSHEFGSWNPSTGLDHGKGHGGRLYTTSLAVLTLETCYRELRVNTVPRDVKPDDAELEAKSEESRNKYEEYLRKHTSGGF